jgi:hypothetical protein
MGIQLRILKFLKDRQDCSIEFGLYIKLMIFAAYFTSARLCFAIYRQRRVTFDNEAYIRLLFLVT